MFDRDVHDAFRAHAVECFPHECCGLVVEIDGAPTYVPCRNIDENPVTECTVHPDDYVAAFERGPVLALLHSHVTHKEKNRRGELVDFVMEHPSKHDMELQLRLEIPFGIGICTGESCGVPFYFGDQVPMRDLVGRPFVYGVWDCYSLVRDYYRSEKGILLPEVPRDHYWWENGGDLYVDWFQKAGFRKIDASEVRPGDGFLMIIPKSKVLNHAGVFLEGSLLLHHLQDHLSLIEPIGRWGQFIQMWLRHKDLDHDA